MVKSGKNAKYVGLPLLDKIFLERSRFFYVFYQICLNRFTNDATSNVGPFEHGRYG